MSARVWFTVAVLAVFVAAIVYSALCIRTAVHAEAEMGATHVPEPVRRIGAGSTGRDGAGVGTADDVSRAA